MALTRCLVLLALLAWALPAAAAERRYANLGFDRIVLTSDENVSIVLGNYAVTATGAQQAIELLQIRQDGTTLTISRRPGAWRWPGKPLTIAIALPRLAGLTLSGGGSVLAEELGGPQASVTVAGAGGVAVRKVRAGALALAVPGSGGLVVADIAADAVQADLAGSGRVVVAGRCTGLAARLSGSGDLNAAALHCATARLALPGSGSLQAHATDEAVVDIAGSGHVVVTGGGRCTGPRAAPGQLRCN